MDTTASIAELQGIATGGGGGPQIYFRKVGGKISPVEVARTEHVPVAEGFYKLRLTGISPIFPMAGQYGKSKNVRIEFTVNDKNSVEYKKRFSQMFPIQRHNAERDSWYSAVTPKTQTGKLIAAVRGSEVEEGEQIDFTSIIGLDFMGLVVINRKEVDGTVYLDSRVVKDGFRPVGSTDVPTVPVDELDDAPTATAAPVASAATTTAAVQPSVFSDDLDDL